MVYINGVLLERGVDYTASNGTSVTGLTALVAGDVATVVTIGTFQIPNAIQLSQVTAKGDLIVANGAATVTNLPVGTDGSILVSNSLSGSGLSWAGPNVGAGKNAVINGGFDVWQRGTSFTNPGSAYTVDRWQAYFPANGTITQETSIVPTGFRYAARLTSTSTSGSNDIYQLVETNNVIPLLGRTVTFSAYVTSSVSGRTPNLNFTYSTTVDDSLFNVGVTIGNQSVTIATAGTFQRAAVTATIPLNARTLRLGLTSGGINSGEYLIWGGVQLEQGAVATPFARAGGTIQGELAACQRYYFRQTSNATNGAAVPLATGVAGSTTTLYAIMNYPVTMRSVPTSVDFANINTWQGGGLTAISNVVLLGNSVGTDKTLLNCTTTGLTNTQSYGVLTNASGVSGYIGLSAELQK